MFSPEARGRINCKYAVSMIIIKIMMKKMMMTTNICRCSVQTKPSCTKIRVCNYFGLETARHLTPADKKGTKALLHQHLRASLPSAQRLPVTTLSTWRKKSDQLEKKVLQECKCVQCADRHGKTQRERSRLQTRTNKQHKPFNL